MLIRIIRPLSISLTIYHYGVLCCGGLQEWDKQGQPIHGIISSVSIKAEISLRRVWLARIFRASYRWKPHHQICSDHFHPDDFIISHQRGQDLGVGLDLYPGCFQLEPGVNPSLLLRPSSNCWHCTNCHYSQSQALRLDLDYSVYDYS